MQRIIAITGGIGSGKSVLSKILRTWGYAVYDCDHEAKRLMDSDAIIKNRIASEISEDIIVGGVIDRKALSEIVFNDSVKLGILNAIVHRGVREDIERWVATRLSDKPVFIETAILYSSGLFSYVDAEIRVIAPENVRIERVVKRNGFTREHIKARIKSQQSEENTTTEINSVYKVENDGSKALLPQILEVLQHLSGSKRAL